MEDQYYNKRGIALYLIVLPLAIPVYIVGYIVGYIKAKR